MNKPRTKAHRERLQEDLQAQATLLELHIAKYLPITESDWGRRDVMELKLQWIREEIRRLQEESRGDQRLQFLGEGTGNGVD